MFILKLFIVIAATPFIHTFAYVHQLTIYSEANGQGDSVTFLAKKSNLTLLGDFLGKVKSYCIPEGMSDDTNYSWNFYRGPSFRQWYSGVWPGCRNHNGFGDAKSIRFHGPSDTYTEAITLFNGTLHNNGDWGEGEELIITEDEATGFGFIPTGVLLTGFTHWTVYYNSDFTGNSTCFSSAGKDYWIRSTGNIHFQSLRRGC